MSAAAPLLLGLGLLSLLGSKKKTAAKKVPALPKPLPKPTPAPAVRIVPGTPPKGGAVPGTPPKGAPVPVSMRTAPFVSMPAEKPYTPVSMRTAPFVSMPAEKPYTPPKKAPTPPKKPSGTVKASPVLEPLHGSTPAGYDPGKARARARAIAAHLAKRGPASYSRAELATWQKQAGLKNDGTYGGSSRGALIFYGVANPPRPFAAPVATLQYVPPEQRK